MKVVYLMQQALDSIETDLTDEEKEIIRQGREEYKKRTYVPLDSIE